MSDLKNLDKLDREFVIEQAIKLAGNKITCDQYLNSIDGLINKLLQKKANVAPTGNWQSNKPDVSSRFSDCYSEEWKLKTQAARLCSMINSGYGRTNKPLPPKRMEELKRNLAEIEAALNGR